MSELARLVRMATKIPKYQSGNIIHDNVLTIGPEQLEIPTQKYRKLKYQIRNTKAGMSQ